MGSDEWGYEGPHAGCAYSHPTCNLTYNYP